MEIQRAGSQPSTKRLSDWFTGEYASIPFLGSPMRHLFKAPA